MPLHVSSTCAHHQENCITQPLVSSHLYVGVSCTVLSQPMHETTTYKCDDTRCCVMQFWLPDDEHICSKHVAAWNKLIVKQKFCASSWLITEINILRCTVSETSIFANISIHKLMILLSVQCSWTYVDSSSTPQFRNVVVVLAAATSTILRLAKIFHAKFRNTFIFSIFFLISVY